MEGAQHHSIPFVTNMELERLTTFLMSGRKMTEEIECPCDEASKANCEACQDLNWVEPMTEEEHKWMQALIRDLATTARGDQ